MRLRSIPTLRSLVATALAFAALSLAPSAEARSGSAGQAHATAAQKQATLFVEWGGSWYAAHEIARAKDGKVLVHYIDWDAQWDETVDLSRMRRRSPGGQGQLFVEWGGSWWPATILGTERDGRVLVHYDGWGKEWDETVDASRMLRLLP